MDRKDKALQVGIKPDVGPPPVKTYFGIEIKRGELAAFCKRRYIKSLALFGSILRDDFKPDSDVDVLIEFRKGKTPGFFELADMEQELSALLGERRVDIRTPEDLSLHFRDRVIQEAHLLF